MLHNIENIEVPLVVSYENNIINNENSQLFKKTLEKCGWEYLFIGEGEEWKGFKTKINGYYNCLQRLPLQKIVILSDARDVFCLRTPLHFMEHSKEILNNKILISAEMFLIGHMEWNETTVQKYIKKDKTFFWQGVPLNKYWTYYNKLDNLPLRKYVNSGLITGKVENLLKAFKWIIENNYQDDQLGFAEYTNNFPEYTKLDYEAKILHTTTYGVNGGLYNIEEQYLDSPTISELLGMSSYFLHIPGLNGSQGQKYIYELIKKILEIEKVNPEVMYKLYGVKPQSNLEHKYIIKNTD